jgi:hypothetical protein
MWDCSSVGHYPPASRIVFFLVDSILGSPFIDVFLFEFSGFCHNITVDLDSTVILFLIVEEIVFNCQVIFSTLREKYSKSFVIHEIMNFRCSAANLIRLR